MLETILNNFVIHVKGKMAEVTDELKESYDFQQVEDVVAELVEHVATDILHVCLKDVLEDQAVLASLKQRGGQYGLNFHGFRKLSVYVYTGRRVEIRSPYFVSTRKKRGRKKAGPNGCGLHLGLELLGFVSRGSSKFVSWITKIAVLVPSYEIAREVLLDSGITLAVNTIRRFCREFGHIGIVARGKISLDGQEDLTGATLVIEVDGGRLRLRRPKRGKKKKGHQRQGYHAEWKEPKLFTMYLVDAQGQILKAFPPIHDATTGHDDAVFALMAQYLDRLDLSVLARVVVCGDGARWIWRRVESLMKNRGVASEQLYQVVDYTHAKQNLQEIVDLVSPKKQTRLMKKWKAFLFAGDIPGLGHSIRSTLRGKRLEAGLKKWEGYFVRNAQRMRYQSFKKHHIPCGSGHVESAIRRVINLHLKAPGTFWTRNMAEYFLFLRSQLLSGRWKIFMKNVRTSVTLSGENLVCCHNRREELNQCATL
jgi:hypothetical protein